MSRLGELTTFAGRGIARRFVALRAGGAAPLIAFAAVLGPGVLAGMSDDDPAGVTTYSILGADFGYDLLWVIPASTALLIVFHLLAIRLATESGKGFAAVIRSRFGPRAALVVGAAFVLANIGTVCAEFAGIGAVAGLAGLPRIPIVAGSAVVIIGLVLGASFRRVEHVLLTISVILASYLFAAVLAHPDWGAVGHGLVVPQITHGSHGTIMVAAALGTTLAPWGLAFIQSYAVDKRITRSHYVAERFEVVVGSLLTGIIGVAVAVACAATLAPRGIHVHDASDAARALEPLAGAHASLLFGVGLAGAGLLAAAIVPLATSYSLVEALGLRGDLDDGIARDRAFYAIFVAIVVAAATIVVLPGVSLVPVVVVSQVINAVLLAPHLVLLIVLNRDTRVVDHQRRLATPWVVLGCLGVALVVLSVGAMTWAGLS